MMNLTQIAAAVAAVGTIGGGALTLDKMHVSSKDFEYYIQQQIAADEAEYVLELKRMIRDVRGALQEHPDDEWLQDELAELIDTLCELRPDDRLCEVDE